MTKHHRLDPTYELQKLIVEWRDLMIRNKFEPPFGALKTLEKLVRSGADLDAVEQTTPCVPYVFYDSDLIKFFLQRGGRDVNATDYAGNTALLLAASRTKLSAVRILLEHNADPNLRNNAGDTPLWMAIAATKEGRTWSDEAEECFKLLVSKSSSSDLTSFRNAQGLTYLHAKFADVKNPDNVIKLLVDRFPDVEVRASNQHFEKTPLMSACETRDSWKFLCRILVTERKADVNAKDSVGRTPLHYAIANRNFECIKFLLSSKADPISAILTCPLPVNCLIIFLRQFKDHVTDEAMLVKMYELVGARYFLNDKLLKGFDSFKEAFRIRTKSDLPPKSPPSDDQKALYKVEHDFLTEADLDEPTNNETLYRRALLTLDRITNSSNWGLLEALSIFTAWDHFFNQFKYKLLVEFLPHLAKTMSELEFESLQYETITGDFFCWFQGEFPPDQEIKLKRTVLSSNIEFFVKLFISPLKNRIKNFGKQVPNLEKIFNIVNHIESKSGCPESAEQLFKTVANLDPRDKEGNGLLHLAIKQGNISMGHKLIDSGADPMAENLAGQTPLEQLVGTPHGSYHPEYTRDLVLKMLSKGAHLDYRTIPSFENGELAQQLSDFNPMPYVSLQCLSARALIRSNVKYKDVQHRVPKTLTTFVDKHFYDHARPLS